MHPIKKINGVNFYKEASYVSSFGARVRAMHERTKGYNARIIHNKKEAEWIVYIRKTFNRVTTTTKKKSSGRAWSKKGIMIP